MIGSASKITIAACAALSTALGSVHAFSVFIPQWESLHGADRASVSLIYSIALASLTVAVLFGYRVNQRLSPFALFTTVGVAAALGLTLSAAGPSLVFLYFSYGLLFGGANGLGYGYALQLAGQAALAKRGLAMGLVTAFYAVGATVAPLLFKFLIAKGGNALALNTMSAIVLIVALVAASMLRWSKASYKSEVSTLNQTLSAILKRARMLLWIGYGSAVAAGLMVIGHAYGIATWRGLDTGFAIWATTVVAFGNMLGGFSAGYSADHISSRMLLRWLPLFTSFGLLILSWPEQSGWFLTLFGLGIVGFCYGAIIAVYPVAVADVYGVMAAPRIYGQVFTAWGLAGLFGPWVSGWIFDHTDSYRIALFFAIILSIVSVIAVRHSLPTNYAALEGKE